MNSNYPGLTDQLRELAEFRHSDVLIAKDAAGAIEELQKQRDCLLAALERAERKLTAYVGVCSGDTELTKSVLPMVRNAIKGVGND